MIELIGLLGLVVGVCALLAWFESPRSNRARYSGRVFDPQRPVIRRAGAERVGANGTGRICAACGAYTWGLSDACGRCGRRSVAS